MSTTITTTADVSQFLDRLYASLQQTAQNLQQPTNPVSSTSSTSSTSCTATSQVLHSSIKKAETMPRSNITYSLLKVNSYKSCTESTYALEGTIRGEWIAKLIGKHGRSIRHIEKHFKVELSFHTREKDRVTVRSDTADRAEEVLVYLVQQLNQFAETGNNTGDGKGGINNRFHPYRQTSRSPSSVSSGSNSSKPTYDELCAEVRRLRYYIDEKFDHLYSMVEKMR